MKATIFDIQRFSVHDGPGIRSVVFFKGCNLACAWCHNPEAVHPHAELAYYADRCVDGCTACERVCPDDAIRAQREDRIDFARCTVCGDCVDVCPANALVQIGERLTVAEVLARVEVDRAFYEASGGGVTLSGGEPLLQARFLGELLPALGGRGIHRAVETAGNVPFESLRPLLPHVDLILYDLKLMDADRHERATRRSNGRILENLRALARSAVEVQVRMPVVPGINTDDDNLRRTAEFLDGIGIGELTLLPYNHLWEAKLPRLAAARPPLGLRPPPPDLYRSVRSVLAEHGVVAQM